MSDDMHVPDESNARPGFTRSSFLRTVGLTAGAATVGGLAACGGGKSTTSTAAKPAAAAAATAGPRRKIIWAVPAIAEWNQAVDVGFHDATRILGWTYQKVGVPIAEYSPANAVNVINQAVQAQPDVIVTPGYVPGAYSAMAAAQKRGILVLINDADNAPEQSAKLGLAHIGADESIGAAALGASLVRQVKAKGKSSGTFLVSVPFAGNANLEAHVKGMKQAAGGDYEVVAFNGKDGAGSAADSLSAYKAKMTEVGGDLVGLVNAGGNTSVLAVKETGKSAGDILIGTFDEDRKAIDNLKAGWLTALCSSQRHSWGYVSTMVAWQSLERGIEPRSYVTGKQIVDKTNLDAFTKQVDQTDQLAKEYKVRLS